MNLRTLLALLLLFCVLLPAVAQSPSAPQNKPAPPQKPGDEKEDVVRITTNLVQVDVVVTKDGKPVPNLTAEDFEIFEDGHKQAITSFAYVSNVPGSTLTPAPKNNASAAPYAPINPNEPHRTIAFVVDDLGLSAESMHQVRRQLRKFIDEQLQPHDLVAILRTGGELGALQQFTNDRRVLNRAVDRLRWNFCNRVGLHVFRPLTQGAQDVTPACGYRSYYNTIKSLRFIIDSMGYLPGRKSMVLLSDSVPRESQDDFDPGDFKDDRVAKAEPRIVGPDLTDYTFSLQAIAEKAIRSSVVIYSVDTQGLQYTGPTAADSFGRADRAGMVFNNLMSARSQLLWTRREGGELIARQTGGFQIRNSNSFQLDRILEDQSGYYLLGYRPSDETFNRHLHHLKAKVKRSGLSLRTRFGFVGITEEEAERAKPKATTQNSASFALASPFAAHDIDLELTTFFANEPSIGSVVRAFVYIDAKNLTFTQDLGRYQGSIELHGVIFGDNGRIVEQISRAASLSLSEEDYQQAIKYGMGVSFDIPVRKPGSYQVRVAARDTASSRIGSTGQFVDVPDLKKKQLAVSGIVLGTNRPDQTIANPGARHFARNSELFYGCRLYNATNEKGQLRNMAMNATLFRDGKNVYSAPEVPITVTNQTDLSRVYVSGVIKLAADLEPGGYFLQVVVTDKDANKKVPPVIQWVDFDIDK